MTEDGLVWRLLPVTHDGIPSLLVATSFSRSTYTVRITDLANIWSESLDRKAIEERSVEARSSIDPSQDSRQMQILLAKIAAAFNPSAQDHNETSLSLSSNTGKRGGYDDLDEDGLLLQVTCILPRPLSPLKWPIHLSKLPQSSVTSQLVLPLITAQQHRSQEVEALISVIREKDSIITKLVDKLEATGIGLENVYTSLSGKRKVSRTTAEERIPGLASFNEPDFRARLESETSVGNEASDVVALIQGVFCGTNLSCKSDLGFAASPGLNNWWTKLKAKTGRGVALVERQKLERQKSPGAKVARTPPPVTASDEGDGDFQVQSTPPHLMSARKRDFTTRPIPDPDDASTDENDEDLSHIPDSNPPPQPPATMPRLGTIGKNKKTEPPPPPAKPAEEITDDEADQPMKDVIGDDDDATASEASEAEDAPSSSPHPQPKASAATQAKQGGLGRIGGKPKADPARASSPSPPSRQEIPSPKRTPPKPAARKLGVIGKKAGPAASRSDLSPEPTSRGRSCTPAAEREEADEAQPRENSEDRADRKRVELQKELERKAAAGPAKKKRKF